MTNQIKYNWASLGTGVIANELAQALEALGGKLYSVANRTYDTVSYTHLTLPTKA